MADKIRIALIGCGGIARGHVKRLLEIPEAEIVSLVDTDPNCLASYKENFPELKDIPVFSDYRDALGADNLDAVHINTPHTLHFPQIMDSLDRGLHVLTEKPLVCSVKEAKEVIAAAEKAGKVLLISYQRHYAPDYVYIKNEIEKGTIDAVLYEEKVKITVVYLTRSDTSVSVRVGTAGSNVGAKYVHDRIEANLKK